MASKLQLDPADPGIADVIAEAKVGQELVLKEVRIVPSSISETAFSADIVGITVEGGAEAEEEETEEYGESPEGSAAPSLDGMPMGGYKPKSSGYDQGTPA